MAIEFPQNVSRAILEAEAPPDAIEFPQLVERAILGPPPSFGSLTFPRTVSRRIFSTDTFEVTLTGAPTGLVGSLTVTLAPIVGDAVYGPTTQQIVEQPAESGRYVATIPYAGTGDFFILWTYETTIVSVPITVLQSGGHIESRGSLGLLVSA